MKNKFLILVLTLLFICSIIANALKKIQALENEKMAVTVNIYYRGNGGNARRFAREMVESGTVAKIRAKDGNLRYEYFFPMEDEETVLLIDSWKDQSAIDEHHASPMMRTIAELRDKYDLHMTVERYLSDDENADIDSEFIRK